MDYARMQAMAKRQIEKNGRPCTFSRVSRVVAGANDSWRVARPAADPLHPATGEPVSYTNVRALLVPLEIADDPKSIAPSGSATFLVAETSFPAGHIDLTTLDRLDDGDQKWRIMKVAPLVPGTDDIVYTITVEN
jgi:hypothetical protein